MIKQIKDLVPGEMIFHNTVHNLKGNAHLLVLSTKAYTSHAMIKYSKRIHYLQCLTNLGKVIDFYLESDFQITVVYND